MRLEMRVTGTVQGVGFRPHVYQLAHRHGLTGWVLNSEQGVLLEVEGPPDQVAAFEQDLPAKAPPLALLTGLQRRELEPAGYREFRILSSLNGESRTASVPADAALCPDCRREMLDSADRRYRYPFVNCTNCGPRFTIVRDIPYDRPQTTMAGFPMCPPCAAEYANPADRRFHAQPNACPACGPAVALLDREGQSVSSPDRWLSVASEALLRGLVLAVKGLGGYHLACDAYNRGAVARLRDRKGRPDRPFAVLARDLEAVRRICRVSPAEEAQLRAPAAPIVLLERLTDSPIAPEVAPCLDRLGVMLPYTPLHLLLTAAGPEVLVMTSGNPAGLPLAIDNQEALDRLKHLADLFVTHNRPIQIPCDDSVVQVVDREPVFLRRSRGYVPQVVSVPGATAPPALGMGGDMKNAFCLLAGERAVFSQHLGDLQTEEAQANFRRALAHLCRLTGIHPELIAHDMHPGYHSTALAAEIPGRMHLAVQHHHAHLAACMADNQVEGEVIGLILDGTGYGPDGAIWGFEVLCGDTSRFGRVAHLAYSPLPGGEGAIRQPLMAATGMLSAHLGDAGIERLQRLLHRQGTTLGHRAWIPPEVEAARGLMRAGVNCPLAGTAGRLFDAVAAISGICRRQTYEGQAAIELGAAAGRLPGRPYPVELQKGIFSPAPLLDGVLSDLTAGTTPEAVARNFLATVLEMLVAGARLARVQTGRSQVCLGGGTFQSAYLLRRTMARLEEEGFVVHRPRQVPPGDGGIALGQAVIMRRRWQERCV